MIKCTFQRYRHQHISHPTYSSFSVILTVHQGEFGPGRTSVTAWPMECGRGDVKWLLMLLIKCNMVFLRHIPSKTWVAISEVELSWSCHVGETTCRKRETPKECQLSQNSYYVFPAQAPEKPTHEKPMRDLRLKVSWETPSQNCSVEMLSNSWLTKL